MAAASDDSATVDATTALPAGGLVRRRAAHLYGLVVTGAVLGAAPDTVALGTLVLALVGTLTVYWAADTYVHWMATRAVQGRSLDRQERRRALRDGLPLVAACTIPVIVLVAEIVLAVPTERAVRIALVVNVALMLGVGWEISTSGGLLGWRRVGSVLGTGLLGVAMITLKSLLH
jgi:hypothetical protein